MNQCRAADGQHSGILPALRGVVAVEKIMDTCQTNRKKNWVARSWECCQRHFAAFLTKEDATVSLAEVAIKDENIRRLAKIYLGSIDNYRHYVKHIAKSDAKNSTARYYAQHYMLECIIEIEKELPGDIFLQYKELAAGRKYVLKQLDITIKSLKKLGVRIKSSADS